MKTTVPDSKNNLSDSNPKIDNLKIAAKNSKSDRTSAATQTIPKKRIKNKKSQETQT